MVKEITQVTKDSKCWCVLTESDPAGMTLSTKMVEIEADEFVDDDLDEEIRLTTKLVETCEEAGNVNTLPVRRRIQENISKSKHYSDIVEVAELLAETSLYQNTKRFRSNYIMISSDLLPIFTFHQSFATRLCSKINGIYLAGKYKHLPVLVLPALDRGQMIWGVNETNSSGIYTFVNDEGKVCNKITCPNYFTMIKLED